MDWTQTYTIIGVNIALIGLLATIMIFAINRIHNDVGALLRRLDSHATRIDQLYRMFVDLVKQKNK